MKEKIETQKKLNNQFKYNLNFLIKKNTISHFLWNSVWKKQTKIYWSNF